MRPSRQNNKIYQFVKNLKNINKSLLLTNALVQNRA